MKRIAKIAGNLLLGPLAVVVALSVRAEDIDLYMGSPSASPDNPNLLIFIDNSANGNASLPNTCAGTKKIDLERCVINELLNDTSVVGPNINVGLGLLRNTPGGGNDGGFIKKRVLPMDATNRSNLISTVAAVNTDANNKVFALSLYEALLYYAGSTPYAGNISTKDAAAINSSTGKYISPSTGNECQKHYVLYIVNGGPDSNNNERATPSGIITSLGGNASTIPLTPSGEQDSAFDEFARHNYVKGWTDASGKQHKIITYVMSVYAASDNGPPVQRAKALFRSAGTNGGGRYFDVSDYAGMKDALKSVFREIQAVNSVFAAVTLPVSVNVRGTYLNQVYMGVFRPDENALPRWMGNLKEYRLLPDPATQELFLADVNGIDVTNNSTGFVTPEAVSYWTSSSSFWTFKPDPDTGSTSDSPDGDIVEKGAAAQYLRTAFATSQAGRKLYTCTGTCTTGSSLSAFPFSTANTDITTGNTSTADATDLSNLINWVRGQDLYDENGSTTTTDARASIHGDVLHSRPAVVNYNRYGDDNDIFVFYGGNDGIFHAIQGGQIQPSDLPSTRRGGTEQWGFIPSDFFPKLKKIRDNTETISSSTPKPYFADGPIGIYQHDDNSDGIIDTSIDADDKVQLFIGMRRGGRLVYALDVTDPTAPKFRWKKSNLDTGYGELGQTWSTPKPVKIKASTNPVLVMGAGYNPTAEDVMPQVSGLMGRGLFVIDATNGSVLFQAGPNPVGGTHTKTVSGMTFSVPADLLTIDRDLDGKIDRAYIVDTGANIWRLDMEDTNPAEWTVNKLASLRGADAAADKRKFLFAPDMVYGDSATGSQPYDAIMIGSGDREHPFDETIVNRFYMIKDPNLGKCTAAVPCTFGATITESDLFDATLNKIQDGTLAEKSAAKTALDAAKGWYITLATGEKVVGGSTTLAGTVFFGTNQPQAAAGSCTDLGTARLYGVSFLDGSATLENDGASGYTKADRSITTPGGGFPPSPVPVVTVIDGKPYEAVVSGTQVQTPPSEKLGKRIKTYWHNQLDD